MSVSSTWRTGLIVFAMVASVLLMATSTHAANRPENMFCQQKSSTSSALGDLGNIVPLDVVADSAGSLPLKCAICETTTDIVFMWGRDSCPGGTTEIQNGVARYVRTVSSSLAVPALSVLGTVILVGGIVTGILFDKRRSKKKESGI